MPLIISPASSLAMLEQIILAGTHMVYTGIKGFCRKEKEGVDLKTFAAFCKYGQRYKVPVIAALNRIPIVFHTDDFINFINEVINAGALGVILNDIGLINKARRQYPSLYIMASIGLSPLNWRETELIMNLGADTVLLSEFLSIDEIKEINKRCSAGIELFFTGIKEHSYTGRCCLSSYYRQEYLENKVLGCAKRGGSCGNACRNPFIIYERKTQRKKVLFRFHKYSLENRLNELLPYVKVFKIGGSLKIHEICDIIKTYLAIVQKSSNGLNI